MVKEVSTISFWGERCWYFLHAVLRLVTQLCLTLCNPWTAAHQAPLSMRILQARTLEWVAISSSNAWRWKVKVKSLSRVRLCVTPWTAAHQAPPSVGFSKQGYWSGVPLPYPCWCLGISICSFKRGLLVGEVWHDCLVILLLNKITAETGPFRSP